MTCHCEHCGHAFKKKAWFVLRGLGRFCSRACFGAAHRQERHPSWKGGIITPKCERCGATFSVNASELRRGRGRFCSRDCAASSGPESVSWKGGRRVDVDGYVLVRDQKRDRPEHVIVAETALGKPLPSGAVVHHVNGAKSDNRRANLVICQDQAYHVALHRRQRVRTFGGDPFKDKVCGRCHTPKPLSAFSSASQGACRNCHTAYERDRRARKQQEGRAA